MPDDTNTAASEIPAEDRDALLMEQLLALPPAELQALIRAAQQHLPAPAVLIHDPPPAPPVPEPEPAPAGFGWPALRDRFERVERFLARHFPSDWGL